MSEINREEAIRIIASYPGPVDKSVVRRILMQMPNAESTQTNTSNALKSLDCVDRQAAIKAIHEVMLGLFDFTDDNIEEPMTYTEVKFLHINKVIAEKIKALPTVQPKLEKNDMPEQGDPAKSGVKTDETCTDCISRQAAIDAVGNCEPGEEPFVIKSLPSAQPEQAKMIKEIRKWINSGNRGSADYFIVDKIEEIINKYE